MSGLSSEYIKRLMNLCTFDEDSFVGVFSCDNFYRTIKKCPLKVGERYIINLSSSNHGGSHWVVVLVNSKDSVEYFDSFGLTCFDSYILHALKGKSIDSFDKQIQHPHSQWCGLYCILYLLCREVNISKKLIASLFDDDALLENDAICLDIILTFIQMRKI